MRTYNFPIKIYYEDTDAGGVVYHANYLKFMERARTECFFKFEKELNEKFLFIVRNAELKYLHPAKLYDELIVSTRFFDIGGASITFEQKVCLANNLNYVLCHGFIKVAHIDKNFRVCRLSDKLLEKLK